MNRVGKGWWGDTMFVVRLELWILLVRRRRTIGLSARSRLEEV